MDQALVKNAKDDVDRGQRSQNQPGHIALRILEGLRGSLEGGVNCRGHSHLGLGLFECGDGVAQSHIGRQIEAERNGRILALMVDLEGGPLL